MKALKSLVIGMGVLIVAGLGVIVVTLYNRASGPGETPGDRGVDRGVEAAAGAPLAAFGTARLGLPAGSAVLGMNAADGRLLLRARLPNEGEWIYVIDLATGATLGKIEVTPGE